MSDNKSLGKVLTTAVAIPLGLWSVFWGLTLAILGGIVGILPVLAGLGGIVAGFGLLVTAYGLFTEQPWTASVGLASFGFDVVRRVYILATDDVTFFLVSALFTAASAGGLVYLLANRDTYSGDGAASPYGAD